MILKIIVVDGLIQLYLKNTIDEIERFASIEKVEKYVDQHAKSLFCYLIEIRVTNKAEFHRKKLMNDQMYHYLLRDIWQRKVDEHLANYCFLETMPKESIEQIIGRRL